LAAHSAAHDLVSKNPKSFIVVYLADAKTSRFPLQLSDGVGVLPAISSVHATFAWFEVGAAIKKK
jgi:hypothetical protein